MEHIGDIQGLVLPLGVFGFFSDFFFFWSGSHVIVFCLTVCIVATKNIIYC